MPPSLPVRRTVVLSLAVVAALTAVLAILHAGRPLADRLAGDGASDAAAHTAALARTCRPGAKLTWAPPALTNPETIRVVSGTRKLELDDAKDYVIDLGDQVVRTGTRITGGRNVVIIGGAIRIPFGQGKTGGGLTIRRQASGGTVHVEGVHFSGAMHDAIRLEQPNDTTVQVQNIHVAELHAIDEKRWSIEHPDLIQTWTGPDVLRVDRLTGYSPFQGLFLEPDDDYYKGPGRHNIPSMVDVRNVNIRTRPDMKEPESRFLWQSTPFPLRVANVWLDSGTQPLAKMMFPSRKAWPNVRRGVPRGGNFVPRETPGIGYRSPGYGSTRQPSGRRCPSARVPRPGF